MLEDETPDPAQVWGRYIELLSIVGPEQLPLEVHQVVLRKSTVSPVASRLYLYHKLEAKQRPRAPHLHEVRYQAIIRNMRDAGYIPDVEDYHFILEQFAAVGHHVGALQVLQEMTHLHIPKTHKTYGLALMSLCHRLTLPIWHRDREKLTEAMTTICKKLVSDMWMEKIPVTSYNVDLTLRVLKETLDYEGFERFLRLTYGVDLKFPDRPPLEYWDRPVSDDANSADIQNPSIQQPFSTAALNSALDFLGRIGNITKLVQAFEVLTVPLPQQVMASADAYADDADEDYGVNSPLVAPYSPPYAEPNTTSYQLMIKWLSRAGRASLARHYLVTVMEKDRLVDRHLRGECLLKQRGDILAPHLGVTHYMFLPILGEANRDKDLEMLRFVLRKIRRQLRRKRFDIEFYTEIQKQWDETAASVSEDVMVNTGETKELVDGVSVDLPTTAPSPSSQYPSVVLESAMSLAAGEKTHNLPSGQPPSHSSSSSSSASQLSSKITTVKLQKIPYRSIPDPTPLQNDPKAKLFDIDLHLSILNRDLRQIEELEQRAMDTLGRAVQRVKERLGRRIWGGKNVYLRSLEIRTRLSRDTWRQIVRFRPTRAVPDREEEPDVDSAAKRYARRRRPGHIAAQQGFFTSSRPSWAQQMVTEHTPSWGENMRPASSTTDPTPALILDVSQLDPVANPPQSSRTGTSQDATLTHSG
jgi:hypothetical protein